MKTDAILNELRLLKHFSLEKVKRWIPRTWRRRLRRLVPAIDYQKMHVQAAAKHLPGKDAKVLVVGCNTGRECRLFVEQGAREVHGLDVVEDIGAAYSHPRIRYFKMSAEAMAIPDGTYHLVYSLATMEHVPRIDLAFPEMARVAKARGIIYSIAAPLWNSRYGHHKSDLFADEPWIHLLKTEEEIIAYCREKGIEGMDGADIASHVRYMLHPDYFNKTPAADYIRVCANLANVKVIKNELDLESDEGLSDEIREPLIAAGYTVTELLAVSHTFIGQKMGAGE